MDGPELLKSLMDAAGDNAHAVATSLKKQSLQSYIWKFVNGKAKEPKRSSLQPLADRYRVPVDAFYDPALAERIAVERGLRVARSGQATPSAKPPSDTRPEPGQVKEALRILAAVLQPLDKPKRSVVASLLSLLANEPDQLEVVAESLAALLPVARTSQGDKSTGTTIRGLGTGGLLQDDQRNKVQARQGEK